MWNELIQSTHPAVAFRRILGKNGTGEEGALFACEEPMRIPAPSIQWPTELATEGPAQDPTILLTGSAKIGNAVFRIAALRMREHMRAPDYRAGVPESVYEESLARMIDDIEDLTDSLGPQLTFINGAAYLLWMVPESRA